MIVSHTDFTERHNTTSSTSVETKEEECVRAPRTMGMKRGKREGKKGPMRERKMTSDIARPLNGAVGHLGRKRQPSIPPPPLALRRLRTGSAGQLNMGFTS